MKRASLGNKINHIIGWIYFPEETTRILRQFVYIKRTGTFTVLDTSKINLIEFFEDFRYDSDTESAIEKRQLKIVLETSSNISGNFLKIYNIPWLFPVFHFPDAQQPW